MKNAIFSFLLFFIIGVQNQLSAQNTQIGVGELCPDVIIKHIMNYKTKSTQISDFKGKLLILDFWATWCGPCVEMIHISDSLQKNFEGKIQILPVTDQDSATVANFFSTMKKFRTISTLSVTDDRVLSNLFPHTVIPHYIWIGPNGRVLAITDAEQLTAENINKMLAGKNTTLAVKHDSTKKMDEKMPMFTLGNNVKIGKNSAFDELNDTAILYHSVITKFIDGFSCESNILDDALQCKNCSIGGLFRFSAGHGELINMMVNSTIWEVTNPACKYFDDSAMLSMRKPSEIYQWLTKYSYCYRLKDPAITKNKRFEIMLKELNNYFGTMYNIECRMEKRKVKCLAFVELDNKTVFASKGTLEDFRIDAFHLKLVNQPMSLLGDVLGMNLDLYPPIIRETTYTGKIDIELNCNMSNLESVNEALQPFGLKLKEKIVTREMVVIKDKVVKNER